MTLRPHERAHGPFEPRGLVVALVVTFALAGPGLAQDGNDTPPGPGYPTRPPKTPSDRDYPIRPGPVRDVEPVDDGKPEPPKVDERTADAKARDYRDDDVAKGDYYFKTGYFLKASESYRVAVLAEPTSAPRKLAFGHSLFAIGNYSYASYALRRGVAQLDAKAPFTPDVASLFPSKKAFEKAVRDLKRYVTYSPRDPAGLSVLGYMLFAQGEDERAKEMFGYLQKLPKNESDAFADFFMKQIAARKGTDAVPGGADLAPVKPAPPPATPAPAPAPVPASDKLTPPEASRQDEEPARVRPLPSAASAE